MRRSTSVRSNMSWLTGSRGTATIAAVLATFRRKSDLWEVVGAGGLGSGKLHDRTDLSGW
jgi:hypothetical protein